MDINKRLSIETISAVFLMALLVITLAFRIDELHQENDSLKRQLNYYGVTTCTTDCGIED